MADDEGIRLESPPGYGWNQFSSPTGQISGLSSDLGTFTAGFISDAAKKLTIDFSNRLITVTDTQEVTPQIRVKLGKLGTAVTDYGIKIFNSTGGVILSTITGVEAPGSGSLSTAIGHNAIASGASAIAIGDTAHATASNSVAIGQAVTASGAGDSTAIGYSANSTGNGTIAIGSSSFSAASKSIAIGNGAVALAAATDGIVIGRDAIIQTSTGQIAIGHNCNLTGSNSIGIGASIIGAGSESICIGTAASSGAGGTSSIAIGASASVASTNYSLVFGSSAAATASNQAMFGQPIASFFSDWTVSHGANGQQQSTKILTELTTIAAAATSDTSIQIPANVIVKGISVRVTTVIPTAATFTVTGTTSGTVFNTANVAVAAGTTDKGNKAGYFYNATAQTVRITPNLSPATATGRVRVTIIYEDITPPTS